jgi:hypothetical protein
MFMPRKLFLAIAVSALLAMLLSLVPGDRWQEANLATFQPSQPIQLTERNALDLFTMVSTHYNIKRIKWDHAAVYVDLAVKPRQNVELPFVYQDFHNMTNQLFSLTYNVNQVYFRLLEESDLLNGNRLLVAIQTDRQSHSNQTTFPIRIEPYFYERISP